MKPEVETRYGRIRGTEVRGIRIFRGVPFARPPVGARRFRGPEPPEPWTGVRLATRGGNAAPQARIPGLALPLAGGRRQAEGCLYLNVFTPGCDDARRPVLVWIHGGGFLFGSGSIPLYDGRDLARRGDLVVVTVNYRLGALGFAHLGGILGDEFRDASNAGLRDQIAALEWVRDHATLFGGDPDRVTVCGQSAGAMSVAALLAAPRARPLFHRAICQSGAAHHVLSREAADEVARVFLEELGGPPATPDALGRIPVERILRAQWATHARLAGRGSLMAFLPVVDGDLLPESPHEALRRGAAADVPVLLGTTLDEWKLFTVIDSASAAMSARGLVARFARALPTAALRAPDPDRAALDYGRAVGARGGRTTPFEVWNAFQSARVFHAPASALAEAHSAGGGRTFSYLFTWRTPGLRRALGAFHALDVPFVFGGIRHPVARPLAGLGRSAELLSHAMQDAWSSFARSGTPASERLDRWHAYDPSQRASMILGRDSYLARAPLEEERELWEQWRGPRRLDAGS